MLDVAGEADTEISRLPARCARGLTRTTSTRCGRWPSLHRIREPGRRPGQRAGASLGARRGTPASCGSGCSGTGEVITLSSGAAGDCRALGVEVLDERPYPIGRPDGTRCWIYQFGLRIDVSTWLAISGRRWEPTAAGVSAPRSGRSGGATARWTGSTRWCCASGWAGGTRRCCAPTPATPGSWAGPFDARYTADTLRRPSLAGPGPGAAVPGPGSTPEPPAADRGARVSGRCWPETTALLDQVIGLGRGPDPAWATSSRCWPPCAPTFSSAAATSPSRSTPGPSRRCRSRSPGSRSSCTHRGVGGGVHLRFGPVARGGLRWSDRPTDYRTEILGLVKAQAVKNAVIVPVGAKGGFVLKTVEPGPEQVTAGYRTFVSGAAGSDRQRGRRGGWCRLRGWCGMTAPLIGATSYLCGGRGQGHRADVRRGQRAGGGARVRVWATRSPPAARWVMTTRRWASPRRVPGRASSGTSASSA